MATIGYIRVSSKDQNTSRQDDSLASCDKVFTDKLSGKNTKRPELQAMLAYVREGDTVLVHSFDRLARSTIDLLNIVETLKTKKVQFRSIKEDVDTSTIQGKLVLSIFAALAEFQRETIKESQKEGIASARERGAKFGRPTKVPENWNKVYTSWKNKEITAIQAYTQLKISKTLFYKLHNKQKEGKNV